jgi:hypothetical protein
MGADAGRRLAARLTLTAAALCGAGAAAAASPGAGPQDPTSVGTASKPSRVVAKSTPNHWWRDGAVRRPLSIDRSLEADFSPGLGNSASVLRPAGSATKSAAPLVSPVLRDETGRARALPGGVLVVLKRAVDDDAARALIVSAGAVPARRISDTIWLLEGPTGLGSLELANRLHESGTFASAQPNWWVERRLK